MADVSGRQDVGDHIDREGPVASTVDCPFALGAGGLVALSVSRAAYSQRVVTAAAYKLSGRWPVLVDHDDAADRWVLYMLGLQSDQSAEGLRALVRELADQTIRERLDDQTRDLRTLIVAQAFSEGNLLDPHRDE